MRLGDDNEERPLQMGLNSAEPSLYAVDDAGVPTLVGTRDSAGNISFPFQTYGSECNGDHGADLAQVTLCGRGTIAATATVGRDPAGAIGAPFTVASIVLAEGPMIRAVLADGSSGAQRGDTVRAMTSPVGAGDDSTRELRFEVVATEEVR